jgi:hypothetical protein
LNGDYELHILIDESGTFGGYHDRSVSVVGALAVPTQRLDLIKRKYTKFRAHLPTDNGEVRGRLLDEQQVCQVVELLIRNNVLFEAVVLDLGFHDKDDVVEYKRNHAEGMLARVDNFAESVRGQLRQACAQILSISPQLYLQAVATFELIHTIIYNAPLYFVQREPKELGLFKWIIDGKERAKVTNWEMWWSWYAIGALANMSKRRPVPRLEGVDYSFYDRFTGTEGEEEGIDIKLLLADLIFCSEALLELELADIVVNATRRALIGTLGEPGWRKIPQLMVHRKEPYLRFILIGREDAEVIRRPSYARIVTRRFSSGGRSMLAPRFHRLIMEERF